MKCKHIVVLLLCMFILSGCGKNTSADSVTSEEILIEKTTEEVVSNTDEDEPVLTEEEKEPATEETDKPAENATNPDSGFYGKLHVEGAHLADANNTPVQLQGISTHGIAWFPDYVNQDVLHQMKTEWGCNVFRIAMYTDENGGYAVSGESDRTARKNLIDKGVQAAIAEDMYVIIDWHILHDNNPLIHKDLALEFFDEMSKKYADSPNVIYEICNEPNGGTSWDDVKTYAREVIPVIRKNSPDAIVLVGTPMWCQEVDKAAASPLTEFDNIMYTLHYYASTHKDDLRNRARKVAEQGIPLFVSEFGVCEASGNGVIDENQANMWIELLNEYGISYCIWSMANKDETASFLNASCYKKSGFAESDLAQAGRWFINRPGRAGFTGTDVTKQKASESKDVLSQETSDPTNQQEQNPVTGTDALTLSVSNSWNEGAATCFQYGLTLQNNTPKHAGSWIVQITFNENITLTNGWCGVYEVKGNTLIIKPEGYNKEIAPGNNVKDIGFIVSGSGSLKVTGSTVSFE